MDMFYALATKTFKIQILVDHRYFSGYNGIIAADDYCLIISADKRNHIAKICDRRKRPYLAPGTRL